MVVLVVTLALVAPPAIAPTTANAAPPGSTPDLTVTSWATGISDPWDIAFLPDGSALITEKTTGVVHWRSTSGSLRPISADQRDFRAAGEGGLMGIAVDPDFARNRRYYTCQNSTSNDVRVIRWRLGPGFDEATRLGIVVDDIPMTSGRHSGCRLAFGYEGYLWITTGDAAIGSAPQNLGSLGGKVLRVNPANGRGHPHNPFFTTRRADRSKIYSYGHRNPQGISRRSCTKQMWTGEHGPSVDDEVNLLARGGNYGWNPVPGYNEGVPMTDFSLPGPQKRAKWRSGAPTIALSGVGWIRGADWGGWDGELAGATLKNAQLWVFEFSNANKLTDTDRPPELAGDYGRLRVPVMGPDGALYVASQSTGTVYRVVPDAGPAPGAQDLNGDRFDDLVVGAPGDDVRGRQQAGSFNVVYGSTTSLLGGPKSELRDQGDLAGAKAQAGDGLGGSVAYGDVDGDGTTDLVVGSPGEDAKPGPNVGAVHVVCGRTNGVEARSSQTFSEAGSAAGKRERGDRLGASVALGDFNGDGHDDVAAGAPSEDVRGNKDAGAVNILYGVPTGITTEHSTQLSQRGSVAGSNSPGDRFGTALAAGDFDGDGFEDLAVGVPGDDRDGAANAGSVVVLYGANSGLGARSQLIDQRSTPSDNQANDDFGTALAAGDFDGDGLDDLAVGAPGERRPNIAGTGEVTVLSGTPSGLRGSIGVLLDEAGLALGRGSDGRFGEALAVGDTNGDDRDELAAGNPGHDRAAGRVVVFTGSASGLGASRSALTQAGAVAGRAAAGHRFGAALRFGDFDDNGRADLAIGVPGETVKGREDAGAVVVVQSSAGGLDVADTRRITRASEGIPGKPGRGDNWGAIL